MHLILYLITIVSFLRKYVFISYKPTNAQKQIKYLVNGEEINETFDTYYLQVLQIPETVLVDANNSTTYVIDIVQRQYDKRILTWKDSYYEDVQERYAAKAFLNDRINYIGYLN